MVKSKSRPPIFVSLRPLAESVIILLGEMTQAHAVGSASGDRPSARAQINFRPAHTSRTAVRLSPSSHRGRYLSCADDDAWSSQSALLFNVRVSTDSQTVENQIRELRQVAERRGWKVVETYSDAGVSGEGP
jgi:predicted transcriptional regulator